MSDPSVPTGLITWALTALATAASGLALATWRIANVKHELSTSIVELKREAEKVKRLTTLIEGDELTGVVGLLGKVRSHVEDDQRWRTQLEDIVEALARKVRGIQEGLKAHGSGEHAIARGVREGVASIAHDVAQRVAEDVVEDTGSHRVVAPVWESDPFSRPTVEMPAPSVLHSRRPTPIRGAPIPREDPPSDPPPPPRRGPGGSSGGRR